MRKRIPARAVYTVRKDGSDGGKPRLTFIPSGCDIPSDVTEVPAPVRLYA